MGLVIGIIGVVFRLNGMTLIPWLHPLPKGRE